MLWVDGHDACSTKSIQGQGYSSRLNTVWLLFCSRSLPFKPPVGFTNTSAQMSSMMSQSTVCMFDQVSRSWIYFKVKHTIMSTLYLLNPRRDLKITMHIYAKCKTNRWPRWSGSLFKLKHGMTCTNFNYSDYHFNKLTPFLRWSEWGIHNNCDNSS